MSKYVCQSLIDGYQGRQANNLPNSYQNPVIMRKQMFYWVIVNPSQVSVKFMVFFVKNNIMQCVKKKLEFNLHREFQTIGLK